MNWLLLVLLAVCLLFIVWGARRGFVRMLVSMIFLILVMALSSWLNPKISTFLMDHTGLYTTFTKNCSAMVEEKLEDSEEELTLGLEVQLIQELPLPSTVKEGLLKNNNEAGYSLFNASQFADYVASYLGNLLVRAVAFLLSYVLAVVILQILLHATDIMTSLPVLSQLNFAGGALLGFVQALLWIGFFFMLLTMISGTHIGTLILSAVTESAGVTWFYNHNLLWLLIETLLMA